jgi:hypothetical protein
LLKGDAIIKITPAALDKVALNTSPHSQRCRRLSV